jgi:hypothetical protein
MGREVRRVAAGWTSEGSHYDQSLRQAQEEWDAGAAAFTPQHGCSTYAEWAGKRPEDPAMYRPDWTDEERTHYQLYETVSEGSPLSPAFATPEELVDWLVNVGNQWDGRWPREQAERFVAAGWAPSLVFSRATGVVKGYEAL